MPFNGKSSICLGAISAPSLSASLSRPRMGTFRENQRSEERMEERSIGSGMLLQIDQLRGGHFGIVLVLEHPRVHVTIELPCTLMLLVDRSEEIHAENAEGNELRSIWAHYVPQPFRSRIIGHFLHARNNAIQMFLRPTRFCLIVYKLKSFGIAITFGMERIQEYHANAAVIEHRR